MLTKLKLEDLSTEEAIAWLDEIADKLMKQQTNYIAIASLDIKALYPIIPHKEGAAEVAELIQANDYSVSNFEFRSAQVNIASNVTE